MLIGGAYFIYSIVSTIALLILFQFLRSNKYQTKLRSYRVYIRCKNYKDIETTSVIITLIAKLQTRKLKKNPKNMELTVTYLTTPWPIIASYPSSMGLKPLKHTHTNITCTLTLRLETQQVLAQK